MYAIVPLFCNKMEPCIQVVYNSLEEILNYLKDILNISSLDMYKEIFQEEWPGDEATAFTELITFGTTLKNCVVFDFWHNTEKTQLIKKFIVSLPSCLHSNTHYLVIHFEGSIKSVWPEVLEHVV